MKKFQILNIFLISATLVSMLFLNSSSLRGHYFQKLEFSSNTAKNSYSLEDPIILYQINSSSDWEIIPGIIGTGTKNDPYVIKDIKNFAFGPFISARNSDAFVIIENCSFMSWSVPGYNDLKFIGCANIEINNCTFNSDFESIYIYDSSQFSITDSIFKTIYGQIRLINCSNFEILTNLFKEGMFEAISLKNCTDSHIFSNNMTGNEAYGFDSGILISGTSINLTVRDNEIRFSYIAGIKIDLDANLITISNNTIYNNKEEILIANTSFNFSSAIGIAQYGAKNCLIEENHIYNMGKDGILLQECENITVYLNILNNNSQNGISIINSSIINIYQNTIVNNYNYGLYSYYTTGLNLEGNIINNNQNEDIEIINIQFYQKYWFIFPSAIVLVGLEFFILIRKNSKKKPIQTDILNSVKKKENKPATDGAFLFKNS